MPLATCVIFLITTPSILNYQNSKQNYIIDLISISLPSENVLNIYVRFLWAAITTWMWCHCRMME